MENLVARLFREREILIDIEQVPPGLADLLKGLPSVLGCAVQGHTLVVTVPRQGDYRKSISELLIAQGLVPLRIEERAVSLEEAFVTITQDTVGSLMPSGGSG